MSNKTKVVYLHQLDPQAALERLNRLTGLQFTSWPKSLRPAQQELLVQTSGMATVEFARSEALGEDLAAVESLSYVALDALALP